MTLVWCLGAVIALEIKYKAPKAHTLLELVYVRWGRWAHMVRGVPCPTDLLDSECCACDESTSLFTVTLHEHFWTISCKILLLADYYSP